MITITPSQAPELILKALKKGLVPYLTGSPGGSKSSIMAQIAKDNNLKVIDLRLSQMDPTEISGLPYFNEDHTKSDFIPPAYFPLEGDPVPKGYRGWLVFFDEVSQAPPAVQNASFKIILDRMVGQHKLHSKVAMVAAGNKSTDKANTFKMGTALQSRLIHLELEVSSKDWLDWAASNNIDYRIMAYIGFKPDALFDFNPNHSDCTFGTPRTWHFLSRLIEDEKELTPNILPLITGTVGEGAGREFMAFSSVFGRIPTIEQIIANPLEVAIDNEPSIRYALSSLSACSMNRNNVVNLMLFVSRLPIEFQIITLQQALKKDISLLTSQPIKDWIARES